LSDNEAQYEIAQKVYHSNLSVRDAEKLVRNYGKTSIVKKHEESEAVKAAFDDLAMKVTEALGTKVAINRKDDKKGKLEIHYNSVEELEAITEYLLKRNIYNM